MDSALQDRIDAMLRRDILIGVTFAALMWLALIFTCAMTISVVDDPKVAAVMAAAAALLGSLNTLGMLSLIRRYRVERVHVYGEDIHHLDVARGAKRTAKVGSA